MRTALLLLVAALTDGAKESRQSDTVCAEGFYQYDPIALRCEGGQGHKVVALRAFPPTALVWRAPNGTRDLDLRVLFTPAQGGRSAAIISARCEGTEKKQALVGTAGSILNPTTNSAESQGAVWSWSGTPKPMENGSVAEWLQINGSLKCDLEVVLENQGDFAVSADMAYSWTSVEPCPSLTKGCEPCPGSDEDGCNEDEMAFCNGSPYWECLPVAAFMSSLTTHAKAVQPAGNTSARGVAAGSAAEKRPAEGNLSIVTNDAGNLSAVTYASEGLASLSGNASNASTPSKAANGLNASLPATVVNASHTSAGEAAAEAIADVDTTPKNSSAGVKDSHVTAADVKVTDTQADVVEANASKANATGASAVADDASLESAIGANATVRRSPSAGTKIWTAPDSASPIPGLGNLGSGNGTGFGLLPLGALPGSGGSAPDDTPTKRSSGIAEGGAAAGSTRGAGSNATAAAPENSTTARAEEAEGSRGAAGGPADQTAEAPGSNASARGDVNGTAAADAIEEDSGVTSTSMDSEADNSTTLPESNETTTRGPEPPGAGASSKSVPQKKPTKHGRDNSTSGKQAHSAANRSTAAHEITPADLGIFGGLGDPVVENESLPFTFPGVGSSAEAGKIGSTLVPATRAQASTTVTPPLEPGGEAATTTHVEPHGSSTAGSADDAAGTSEPMISVIESAHNQKGDDSEDGGGGDHQGSKRPSVRGSSQKSEKQTMPIDLPSWQTAGAAVLVSICSMLFTLVFALFCLAVAARRLAAQSELDHKALRQRQMAEQRFDRLPTSEHGSRMGW